jgi:hypothetical protein
LVLTESRDVLRPWQRLTRGCDAHVVHREVCTACGMRFDVEPNTTEPQPTDAENGVAR